MTSRELQKLIEVDFKVGLESLKYSYQNEFKENFFKIELELGKMKAYITTTRESVNGDDMLIAPKLLQRIRTNIRLVGNNETNLELLQEGKKTLVMNKLFDETPEVVGQIAKIVAKLMGEVCERKMTLQEPEVRR